MAVAALVRQQPNVLHRSLEWSRPTPAGWTCKVAATASGVLFRRPRKWCVAFRWGRCHCRWSSSIRGCSAPGPCYSASKRGENRLMKWALKIDFLKTIQFAAFELKLRTELYLNREFHYMREKYLYLLLLYFFLTKIRCFNGFLSLV